MKFSRFFWDRVYSYYFRCLMSNSAHIKHTMLHMHKHQTAVFVAHNTYTAKLHNFLLLLKATICALQYLYKSDLKVEWINTKQHFIKYLKRNKCQQHIKREVPFSSMSSLSFCMLSLNSRPFLNRNLINQK